MSEEIETEPTTLAEFNTLLIEWGTARKIFSGATPQSQFIKVVEEAGEITLALKQWKGADLRTELADAIGDTYVTLVMVCGFYGVAPESDGSFSQSMLVEPGSPLMTGIGVLAKAIARSDQEKAMGVINALVSLLEQLAITNGLTLVECVAQAWEEIKDRTGEMVDGVFIRDIAPTPVVSEVGDDQQG